MDEWTRAAREGDFAAAWRISDRILEQRRHLGVTCAHRPRHLQFIWSGEPLQGKRVLVHCYHGLGDTIQFVRLLAPLRKRATWVCLWAQPALLDLLRHVAGIDRLLPLHDGAPDADHDADIELMELPHALRLGLDTIPREIPYLHVPSAIVERDSTPRVGICWSAGPWNPQRSIPAACLLPLAHCDVRWHSLQFPDSPAPFAMERLGCRSIAAFASRMRSLDLVISVDTMQAHLAGALGLPVWLLLPHDADWRWMTQREDSPWYPTMRIFRQQTPGDWAAPLQQIREALQRYSSARYSFSRL